MAVRYVIAALALTLAACAPLPASAGVASVGQAQQLATAIPSQTATPDIRPQMTDAAASLQLTNDAAYLAASNATQAAGWTAVAINATSNAIALQGSEIAATQQSMAATQTQAPLDIAASATVAMQQQINSTATAIADNADSQAIRENRVTWSKRIDVGWALFLLGLMTLAGIAGVCVVYYIWRGSENRAEGVSAIARAEADAKRKRAEAEAHAITLKAETEAELMRERDRLAARLQARIREVGDRASERMANVKTVPAAATQVIQEPSGEGFAPGTYNATTELVLRTLKKAASIAPLGWDDPVIPPQGLAWGGNGTRQTVVDLLNERGLVRTKPGQGADKGTRVQEHGTIRGLYEAIADGQVVIYETRPTPLEVTANAE